MRKHPSRKHVLSKVVERVVHSQLNTHLYQLDFLYRHQYGFRRGHSTEQAITQLNNWVLESMDEGNVTGLLFVDISKAFDSLNHKVLLRKLNHLGVSKPQSGLVILIKDLHLTLWIISLDFFDGLAKSHKHRSFPKFHWFCLWSCGFH